MMTPGSSAFPFMSDSPIAEGKTCKQQGIASFQHIEYVNFDPGWCCHVVGRTTALVYFTELKKMKKKRRMVVGGNRLERKMTLREEGKEMRIRQ
jgi:hypothetical protein